MMMDEHNNLLDMGEIRFYGDPFNHPSSFIMPGCQLTGDTSPNGDFFSKIHIRRGTTSSYISSSVARIFPVTPSLHQGPGDLAVAVYPIPNFTRRGTLIASRRGMKIEKKVLEKVALGVIHSLLPALRFISTGGVTSKNQRSNDYGETGYNRGGKRVVLINMGRIKNAFDFVLTILHELAHVCHGYYDPDKCPLDGHCAVWGEAFALLIAAARRFQSGYLTTVLRRELRWPQFMARTWLRDLTRWMNVWPTA